MTRTRTPLRRLLRHLVLWLFAAALPWQGVAAATMAHAAPVVPAHDATPCHGNAPSSKAMTSSPCGACVACCVLAALPALPDAVAARANRSLDRAHPPLPRVAFLTDGPLRPPRFSAA